MSKMIKVSPPGRAIPAALRILVMVAALGILVAGCAAIRNEQAIETERLLSASGFQMKLANTPEKLEHLKTLTQRKLVPHQRHGAIFYVYADAETCHCLYVGTEDAYQRYQKLSLQREIADKKLKAAQMNQDTAMDWDIWGPWGPWY